jgi:hypothetical protein
MDKAELLSAFENRVNQFERYQGFIQKAKEHGSKFAPSVVEKVVQDNEQKSLEVVLELIPLTADMDEVVADTRRSREGVLSSVQDAQFKLEELSLRKEIGDIDDDTYESEAGEYRKAVTSVDAKVAEFDQDLAKFATILDKWNRLGQQAGVLQETVSGDPQQPQGTQEREEMEIEMEAIEVGSASPTPPPVPRITPSLRVGAATGSSETGSSEGFEVGDLDILGEEEDIELDGGEAATKEEEKSDKPRRAVLLYQEGTPEEQIYPFSGEAMSLGRGRDNDVQVKNDSKVSRYHCKLYRRGPNFYVEDNKSANGTLVNGELITERRLFGGEEVIIGETFFRFRILD